MKHYSFFVPVFTFLMIFVSCTKDPAGGPNPIGGLIPFKVTVVNRLQTTAKITWEASASIFNSSDSIHYKVAINNRQLATGLSVTSYNITGISPDTLYNGLVTAYTAGGDTATAAFVLEKVNGIMWYSSENDVIEARGLHTSLHLFQAAFGTAGGGSNIGYFSSPVFSNDTMFIANSVTSYFSLQAFNAKTGANIWRARPYSGGGYNTFITTELTYNQGKLFGIARNGATAVNAATGQTLWTNGGVTGTTVSTPIISDNKLLVAAGSTLFALDPNNGSELWRFGFDGDFDTRPVVYNNVIVFSTRAQKTYGVNKTTGAQIWMRDFVGTNKLYIPLPAPVIQNNLCIVGSSENGVFGLNPLTGATTWNYRNGLDEQSNFALNKDDGICYFAQTTGFTTYTTRLTAINCATGELVWEKNNGAEDTGNLIYVKGKLYMRHYIYRIESISASAGSAGALLSFNTAQCGSFTIVEDGVVYYHSSHGNF